MTDDHDHDDGARAAAGDDRLMVYPTNRVVGIARDGSTLEAVETALDASGVDADRIEVWCGEDAQRSIDTEGDEGGVLRSALRTVQRVLGDEAPWLERLERAVQAGQYVATVALPDDLDAEAKDAEKRAVGNALHDAGAVEVVFYGRNSIEELQIGA